MTDVEIRDKFTMQLSPYAIFNDTDVEQIQKLTRLSVFDTMENLALWKGGNTPEEKITHFFAVLRDAKEQLERDIE